MVEQMTESNVEDDVRCLHCGDPVDGGGIVSDGMTFCCNGCRAVFQILHPSDSCPVIPPGGFREDRFAYLDEPSIIQGLRTFTDGMLSAASFFVPQMHCSSCVWLLENLFRLDPGILVSRVDFMKKTVMVRYAERDTTLRKVVELLAVLGYEPRITLGSVAEAVPGEVDNSLYYRVGVAGFCFGNIMILSFPEYLSGGSVDPTLHTLFSGLILALSFPVMFYCSTLFFRFAVGGLRKGIVTIDLPIAAGILILFSRSAFEIITSTGSGYSDSLAGLVFFLLLGRLFQAKTYDALNFDRTYVSYFPLAVTIRRPEGEKVVRVTDVHPGDRMVIRNNEILPADAVLMSGEAAIDYSFVTGEARTVRCENGSLIYAGGRQVGGAIELEAVTECSRSYLTRLWNSDAGTEVQVGRLSSISNVVSKYFTYAILAIAAATGVYWLPQDLSRAVNAVTAVLIVACPCALALSTPFALGTAQRLMGRARLYLKNADVVERMARVSDIVLDKTGTLTRARDATVRFVGTPLSPDEQSRIATVVHNSHHPLSRSIFAVLAAAPLVAMESFSEEAGRGLEALVEGHRMRVGSAGFAGIDGDEAGGNGGAESRVYVTVDNAVRGYFAVAGVYRAGIGDLLTRLAGRYGIALLTGDSDWERTALRERFGAAIPLHFGQTPEEKRDYLVRLQKEGKSALMVGDGLNDAVALRVADVGIALTDDTTAFTPASDGILDGSRLVDLDCFLSFARKSRNVVVWSYGISFLYNVLGLSFAIRGALSPVVAAILMPLSSITVVAFTTMSVRLSARKAGVTP
jgi:Cu+-exporting ATPase